MGVGVGSTVGVGVGLSAARLAKRPLGRTHSAPLPLGDPQLHPPTAHHYLRDQIRKTVRKFTINHSEFCSETTILSKKPEYIATRCSQT